MSTTERQQKIWNRYRWWKLIIVPFLGLAAFVLLSDVLRDDSQPSLRLYVGLGIAVFLGAAYLLEEVFWIVRNQGQPCAQCGARIHLKPFRVKATCPACGADL